MESAARYKEDAKKTESGMIKKLQLIRFRSHDNVTLDFKPGVNVITGNSDSGKTNFIRAIRWLAFNRPAGFSMHSHWAKGKEATEVTATLSDNRAITRYRDNARNEYRLSTLEEPLEAVRTDVPDPVREMLNMDALNVATQGEKPYLLDDSPPEVARILNAIAGLDGIDTAHTRIAAKIRDNQEVSRNVTVRISQLEEQLGAFTGLEAIQDRLDAYNAIEAHLATMRVTAEQLSTLIEETEALAARYAQTDGVADLWARGAEMAKQWAETKSQLAEEVLLTVLCANNRNLADRLSKIGGLSGIAVVVDAIERMFATLATAVSARQGLDPLLTAATSAALRLSHTANAELASATLAKCQVVGAKIDTAAAEFSILAALGAAIAVAEKKKVESENAERTIQAELAEFTVCPTCGADSEHWRIDAAC